MVRISTAVADVDVDWLHAALSERAYWAIGRPREIVERSLAGSLCFSLPSMAIARSASPAS